ncbi:MAG TPA: hypothetical protein ENI42_06870, partial [Thermoplasmatales archaeon]|nr:hypothetical protein [Thermoplasmatales archaeon]
EPGKTYVFFSHTIKGQKHNMPMLKRILELNCTLIDYEKIVDERGRRLVFFGRYAGLAGMIDTLWAFGRRLRWEDVNSPFNEIKQTIYYKNLEDAKKHLSKVGDEIKNRGLPESITPLVVGFAGYGNVSRGAQEIIDVLPTKEIKPEEIEKVYENPSKNFIYKIVFKEEHMVEPLEKDVKFDLMDYYTHPERYKSVFEKYIPHLSILMNCIYWDARYPRLVTKTFLKRLFTQERDVRLRVVGDISCDINGAVEFNIKATEPDNPVYVYNPLNEEVKDGYTGEGVVVLAVDNLPCELPRESSTSFSESLWNLIPGIVKADYSLDFKDVNLPSEIKRAVIVYKGRLTPDYQYMNKYL